jgi:hypothetical protein
MVVDMSHGVPLPDVLRRQIRELIENDGEALTVARLGISRLALARAVAGLPLYPGTHALIRQRLEMYGDDGGDGGAAA